MVREGNFLELVGYLVDGTEVNFDYVRGTPGSRSRLVLLASLPAKIGPQTTPDTHTENVSDNAIEAAVSVLTAEFGGVTQAPSFTAQATDVAGDAQQLPRPQSTDAAAAQKAAEMMYGGGRATEIIPSAYLPFSGSGWPPDTGQADQSGKPVVPSISRSVWQSHPRNTGEIGFAFSGGRRIKSATKTKRARSNTGRAFQQEHHCAGGL